MRKQLNLTDEVCEFLDKNIARHVQGQFVSLAIMKFKNSQIAKSLMVQNRQDPDANENNSPNLSTDENGESKMGGAKLGQKQLKSSNTIEQNANDVDYDERF